jgi:hypothetical protein
MTASRRSMVVAGVVAATVTFAGGVPRVLLAAGALPDLLRPFVWSDALFVYERGLSAHRLPYVDTPFEYPPLIGVVSGVLSLLSPDPMTFVLTWAFIVAIAAGCCAALLAAASGRRVWPYFVLAPQLLLLGTVNFDLLPAALMTAAVVAQRSGRAVLAMLALALGTAAKLFPAASAPLAALRAPRRVAAFTIFVLTLAALYLPTALQPFSSIGGVGFYAVGIRSNIDSIWGLAERFLTALGATNAGTLVLAVTIAGLAATYLWRVLPRGLRAVDPAVGFCLATIALLFWSRLYSPQYSLWLLPFFALLALPVRAFALLAIADLGVFFTIYPLTLVQRAPDDLVAAALFSAMAAFVVLRHLALWWMWRAVVRGPADGPSVAADIRS